MTVRVAVIVVVVESVRDLGGALAELGRRDDLLLDEHVLQRVEPALVVGAAVLADAVLGLVGGDLGDQARAEDLVVDRTGVVQRDRNPERTALPRRLEDELAVAARQRRRPVRGGDARAACRDVMPRASRRERAQGRCRPCCRA